MGCINFDLGGKMLFMYLPFFFYFFFLLLIFFSFYTAFVESRRDTVSFTVTPSHGDACFIKACVCVNTELVWNL